MADESTRVQEARELQRKADESPRVQEARELQRKADESPRVQKARELQHKTNKISLSRYKISHPIDPAEKEADRIANKVIGITPPIKSVDRKEISRQKNTDSQTNKANISGQIDSAVNSGGSSLPSGLVGEMENKMNQNFSDVTVHNDEKAHKSAAAIDAQAYTMGSDIVFAKGEYSPGSMEGKHLIAHELVHVAQQGKGAESVYRETDSYYSDAVQDAIQNDTFSIFIDDIKKEEELNGAYTEAQRADAEDKLQALYDALQNISIGFLARSSVKNYLTQLKVPSTEAMKSFAYNFLLGMIDASGVAAPEALETPIVLVAKLLQAVIQAGVKYYEINQANAGVMKEVYTIYDFIDQIEASQRMVSNFLSTVRQAEHNSDIPDENRALIINYFSSRNIPYGPSKISQPVIDFIEATMLEQVIKQKEGGIVRYYTQKYYYDDDINTINDSDFYKKMMERHDNPLDNWYVENTVHIDLTGKKPSVQYRIRVLRSTGTFSDLLPTVPEELVGLYLERCKKIGISKDDIYTSKKWGHIWGSYLVNIWPWDDLNPFNE